MNDQQQMDVIKNRGYAGLNFNNNPPGSGLNNNFAPKLRQQNGVDKLLNQVMNADNIQVNKNFSPVKRDVIQQRQQISHQ